jgi:biotin carboxylase
MNTMVIPYSSPVPDRQDSFHEPMTSADRPVLLLVDNRPSEFTRYVLSREDVQVVLLRFDEFADVMPNWPPWGLLPDSYLRETTSLPAFSVCAHRPLEEEASRYLKWVTTLPEQPRYFCNPEEHLQEIAQRFAGLVGLPHLSEQQVRWVRKKPDMKDKFQELGIPCARYRCVENAAEVNQFAVECGWPLVLKPIDSYATMDTYRIDGPDDLDLLARLHPSREWMVEEFLTGKEYQLCALVAAGRVLDTFLSVNPSPLLETLSGSMNADITVGPGYVDESLRGETGRLVQRLVDGMALEFGYLHMEFFLSEDGTVHLGEIGARLAGCGIPRNHGLAYGFDVFGATLDVYLHREPELLYTEDRCVGDLLLPTQPGRVAHITPIAELLELPGVISANLEVGEGDVLTEQRASILTEQRASNARSGCVHVVGATVNEVIARMRDVLAKFDLQVV